MLLLGRMELGKGGAGREESNASPYHHNLPLRITDRNKARELPVTQWRIHPLPTFSWASSSRAYKYKYLYVYCPTVTLVTVFRRCLRVRPARKGK